MKNNRIAYLNLTGAGEGEGDAGLFLFKGHGGWMIGDTSGDHRVCTVLKKKYACVCVPVCGSDHFM